MIRRWGVVLTGMLVLLAWNGSAAVRIFPGASDSGKGSPASGSDDAGQAGVWVAGTVRRTDAAPAAGVAVRVWRADRRAGAEGYREVRADRAGRYRVALPDGAWRIVPCGSPAGYVPAYWDVTVEQGRVVGFQQVDRADPEIRAVDLVGGDQGSGGQGWVVLEGEGFGCSGRVEVELEDGRSFEVTEFEEHTDARIRFRVPEAPGGAGVHRARLWFVVGPARAGPVQVERPRQGTVRGASGTETGTETGAGTEPLTAPGRGRKK